MGSRADLWPLEPVIARAAADDRFTVTAVVSAADARLAGVDEDLPDTVGVVTVGRRVAGTTPSELVGGDAVLLDDLGAFLGDTSVDLLLCLGDRHELLAVAGAALLHGVPIVHLHGGEVTTGSIDDSIRHAMSKMAVLHLVATTTAARRLEQMGEEPWRIHVTGAPGLDRIAAARADDRHRVAELLGGSPERPIALLTFHPATASPGDDAALLEALLSALDEVPTVIATMPGLDVGATGLAEGVRRWAASRPGVHLVESLGGDYADVLVDVDVVVGNSSSGIIEAPTAGVPVIDVGARQDGRERSSAVLHAEAPAELPEALRTALSADHRAVALVAANPYGDGGAGQRAVDVLATVDLGRLVPKRWVDLGEEAP